MNRTFSRAGSYPLYSSDCPAATHPHPAKSLERRAWRMTVSSQSTPQSEPEPFPDDHRYLGHGAANGQIP